MDYELPPIAIYTLIQRTRLDFDFHVDYVALNLIKPKTHTAVEFICLLTHFLGVKKLHFCVI